MYFYAENDQQKGPVDRDELKRRINPQTLVWREGMPDWLPAGQVPELADLFSGPSGGPFDRAPSSPSAHLATPEPTPASPVAVSLPAQSTAQSLPPEHAPVVAQPISYQYPTTSGGSGLATASLVLGIVGVTFGCVYGLGLPCSILALIFGYIARSNGAVGQDPRAGLATAGIVLGWIPVGIALAIAVVALVLVVLFAIIGALS
jgi:GYF domain 2/Domain of unknown function (DUF4190)